MNSAVLTPSSAARPSCAPSPKQICCSSMTSPSVRSPIKVNDLLEILDDRYEKSATIITSQLEVKQWHTYLDDPTLADAILDRVVHNAYQLDLSGESIRKLKSLRAKNPKHGGTQPKGSASIAAHAAL